MPAHDTIYQNPLDKIADFAFDEKVVSVFPDMIQRSVPGYNTIIAMTGMLAGRYAKQKTRCYDLGCSLGASMIAMADGIKKQHNDDGGMNHIEIIGIDNSAAMISRCKQIMQDRYQNTTLHCQNIEKTVIENASVVVLNFSLQFIPKTERDSVLTQIYNGMLPNGILILSEKIRFNDPHLDQLNIELHHEFKKANGYSELEISQKRSALENVLIPETLETHQQRLKKIGFQHCDVWFQCFNFASIVAIK